MLRWIGLIAPLIVIAMPGLAKADTVEEWRKQMAIRLNSNKGFTPITLGQSGTVKVGFVIDRTGKLVSNWLAESTGIPASTSGPWRSSNAPSHFLCRRQNWMTTG